MTAIHDGSMPNPHDNSAHLIYTPSIVFVILLPTLVFMRVWIRIRHHGKLGIDDLAAIAAMIFTLLTCLVLVIACHYGMGKHWVYLDQNRRYQVLKYFYLCQVFYKAAINLSKISIIMLYLRIFGSVLWFSVTCWILVSAIGTYCFASVVATILQCIPVRKAFQKDLPGHCIDLAQFWFANAGFSISTDVIILILPMTLVSRLHVSFSQKMALVAIFALGIFVVFTSCFRVTTLDMYSKSPDMSYDITNVMWTIIEPATAVVCSNLPILRPAVVRWLPSLRSKSSRDRANNSQYASEHISNTDSNLRHPDDRGNLLYFGRRKTHGLHLTTIHRNDSIAGSEHNILGESDSKGESSESARVQQSEYSEASRQGDSAV